MIGETSSAGIPAYHTSGIGTGPANLSLATPVIDFTSFAANRPGHTRWEGEGWTLH
jgi:hypothetical protein